MLLKKEALLEQTIHFLWQKNFTKQLWLDQV